MSPLSLLLIGVSVVVIIGLCFWPSHGIWWRLHRRLRMGDRVLKEDALKHLYDCETKRCTCSIHSLGGRLAISPQRAGQILNQLVADQFVVLHEGFYRLSEMGRREALRIIRLHRLWEHYLAEETSIGPHEWHAIADRKEHSTSADQAEALAQRLHSPRFDPHGDPIPTADGEIIALPGQPLTDFDVGTWIDITHVEDEPVAAYQELVKAHLTLGARIKIISKESSHWTVTLDGTERSLSPLAVANIWGKRSPVQNEKPKRVTLADLPLHGHGTVTGIAVGCRGLMRRRLLDLGFLPGTEVTAELRGIGRRPTAYRIRGALVALRDEQARWVTLSSSDPNAQHAGETT